MNLKNFLCESLPLHLYEKVRRYWHNFKEFVGVKSIEKALHEQGLSKLTYKLSEIVPDITNQYSTFKLDTEYLIVKTRAQHAFQIHLVLEAIKLLNKVIKDELIIIDIGDSAGTHIQYIKALFRDRNIRSISVNLDEGAVKRIKEKGLEAICVRAEELTEKYSINADIFLCFEMLEHLMNPAEFLHKLSTKTDCKLFVVTVPYLKSSRVGLHHIRNLNKKWLVLKTLTYLSFRPKIGDCSLNFLVGV